MLSLPPCLKREPVHTMERTENMQKKNIEYSMPEKATSLRLFVRTSRINMPTKSTNKSLSIFMSGSMGFSINNTKAVLQGLFKKPTPFIRTPKYRLIGKSGSFSNKNYQISMVKTVFIEILMAIYSCLGVIISVYYFELGIIPFMLMFSMGFAIIGYLSIKHHLSLKYGRI